MQTEFNWPKNLIDSIKGLVMQRRKFISFSAAPALGTLLAACGGGDESPGDGEVPSGDTVIEAGVDPAGLSSVPDPIKIDLALLQEKVGGQIRASVVLGSQAQANVPVTFYDAAGKILGSAVTDSWGIAVTELPALRLVVAEAQTPDGRLFGMRFYSGNEFHPTLYIDILQSVFVEVIVQMVGEYNVSMYVLQDYFRVSRDVNVLNIGHENASLDQRLVCAEWKKSGDSLDSYVEKLNRDIMENIDDDAYFNLRFNSYYSDGKSLKKGKVNSIEEDLVKKVGEIAIKAISDAVRVPFASDILKFAFGKFTSQIFPGPVDPFVEVRERLQAIEDKIDDLKDIIVKNAWSDRYTRIRKKFNNIVDVKKKLKELQDLQDKIGDVSESQLYKDYVRDLLRLLDDNEERNLGVAYDMFFGLESQERDLSYLLEVHKNNKFYSKISEGYYRGYLAAFLSLQSIGYMFLVSSYIVKSIDDGVPENVVSAEVSRLLGKLSDVVSAVNRIDVEPMPERVNIDVKNKTAWIGSCGLIGRVTDFWPPNRQACHQMSISLFPVSSTMFTPLYACIERAYGNGLEGWAGPDPKREMARADAYVTDEIRNFGKWRSPSESEFKASFYTEAKRNNKKIDVYAVDNGFSCVQKSSGIEMKAFSNYPLPQDRYQPADPGLPEGYYRDGLAEVPTQFRRAGHAGSNGANYYIDCTRFDLRDYSVDSRNVRNNYGMEGTVAYSNPSRYVFFPVCELSDADLKKYIPWLHVS